MLFALGLAAGEAAVQALAMVVVLAVVERRYTRIVAPAVLVAAYAVVRRGLGVGVSGSGQYLDPMVDPLGFVKAAPARLAALLGDLLGGVPSDLWLSMPAMRPRLVATGVVVTALVVWLTLRALKTMEPAARRTLVGLVAAGLLAMLPGLAGVPGSRIVFASSFASAALVATLLVQLRSAWRWWLVVTHAVMAPLMLLGDQAQVRTMAAATDRAMAQTALVGDVAIVSAPDAFVAIYPPYIDTRYRSYRLLTLTPRDVAVTRVGARSLRVETVTGAFFDSAMEESVRPVAPAVGTTVRQGAMTATVESPRALRFDWDGPLEAVRVMAWQGGALRPLALPAVGETVTVRREVGMMGL